jgi:chemotaxis protein CheD
MSQTHVVGISELIIAANPEDTLITYSLGSCIGVTVYDKQKKTGGMIHCMLPLSKIDLEKAAQKPAMFVDTGLILLLQSFFDNGSTKRDLIVKVAGGAATLDKNGIFNIGERNYTVVRKILWKNNILIAGEDVGGDIARTMSLTLADGVTLIKSGGTTKEI